MFSGNTKEESAYLQPCHERFSNKLYQFGQENQSMDMIAFFVLGYFSLLREGLCGSVGLPPIAVQCS